MMYTDFDDDCMMIEGYPSESNEDYYDDWGCGNDDWEGDLRDAFEDDPEAMWGILD